MTGAPWRAAEDGLLVAVRIVPRGGRDAIDGIGADAEGEPHLRIRVAAPPVDGAANASLIRTVAKALGVRKSDVSIAAGESARSKRLHIRGDAAELAARLSLML